MQKLTLLVYCLFAGVVCSIGWSLRSAVAVGPWSSVTRNKLQLQVRQRFLVDLLLQVHKPLLNRRLVTLGSELNADPSQYQNGTWHLLAGFMDLAKKGSILGASQIYNQVADALPQQLLGVYRFLALAKDWSAFQRNACYARTHFNPVLFVNALQLAVRDRQDARELQLPAMYEVLPQLYFTGEVVKEAQQSDWQLLAVSTVGWPKILSYVISPRRVWPWPQSRRIELVTDDPVVVSVQESVRLCSDVELNGYWNNVINRHLLLRAAIMDQPEDSHIFGRLRRQQNDYAIVDGDRMMPFTSAKDESDFRAALEQHKAQNCSRSNRELDSQPNWSGSSNFVQSMQQLVSRLQLDDLVTGSNEIGLGASHMLTTGGTSYQSTALAVEVVNQLIGEIVSEFKAVVDTELFGHYTKSSMRNIGELLEKHFWRLFKRLYEAINGDAMVEKPTMLGIATNNLRDPIYRSLLMQLMQLVDSYERPVQPPTVAKVQLEVQHINVSRLQTYEELVDTDLINLIDLQLLQTEVNNLPLLQRRLVARQRRLNHRPFSISYDVHSLQPVLVLVRTFLVGPTSWPLLLDGFTRQLTAGSNHFVRNSQDVQWTGRSAATLSDFYGANGVASTKLEGSINGWPHRLLLPRGNSTGLRLQLLVLITPWSERGQSELNNKNVAWMTLTDGLDGARALKDVLIEHQTVAFETNINYKH